MTANQNRKIISGYIEDEFTIVAFILIDSHFTNIEIFQYVL